MSLAIQLIKSCIATEDTASFRQSNPAIYLESELPLYEFCSRHFGNHRVLPDEAILTAAGFTITGLPTPHQPSTYYLERMKHRLVFNVLSENLEIVSEAMSTQDMEVAVSTLRTTLGRVGSLTNTNTASVLDDILDEVRDDYLLAKHTHGLRGVTLGYDTLDEATLGAMGGDLVVVAGRPGAGKTSALLKMANAAHLSRRDVLFISMEMPKLQISRRYLGLSTGINPNYMRAGQLSRWGEAIMEEGISTIKSSPHKMYLESGDFQGSVDAVEAMVQQFSPEAVYVDAAYLLTPEGQQKGYVSKWESLAEVVKQLKKLAINYGIPVFISVQFNRNQKDKSTNEPDLSDIAGTDSIPQDASIVLGIQKPPAPYSDTRRLMKMMKNREGDLVTVLYNYLFNPVNFDEQPYVDEDDEGSTPEAQPLNTDWMV